MAATPLIGVIAFDRVTATTLRSLYVWALTTDTRMLNQAMLNPLSFQAHPASTLVSPMSLTAGADPGKMLSLVWI